MTPLRLSPGTDLKAGLLALLPAWRLARAPDAATGYSELVVHPRA